MPMNLIHRRLCSSDKWARAVEDELLPWALEGVPLGPDTLEIGPGYGATTRVLLRQVANLSAVEADAGYAARLRREFGGRVEVIHGDGADLPLPDTRFDSVACFTMLHHVPSPAAQDRLFAEAHRVLRPGGLFTGCDALSSWGFRLLHLGDTCVPVPPRTLPARLRAAGFADCEVTLGKGSFRFLAYRR
ncbi:class I SAM-dependent methyltransferase [Streptomyces olivoreticuli]|uniref:class I SAM-dependent methyltransferase n=1 Tax=Streptomyces olivoreticuli TaxID=68246 RepID=UPI0026592DD6|nr:class I SAM-dependent methyltransferase [Streptomyces olivoreticuli]WKK26204.1 class I SAM-dependent methyltransferase [Streptomyces olivoreticuli]